jgi:anti-anti-sigma factor
MVRPSKFEIMNTADGARPGLSIRGELDMRTVGQLTERVGRELDNGPTELTLDLRELRFMDSSGLRMLIELDDRSRQEGWRLRLLGPEHEAAALVLRSTGADEALPFVEADEA